jgi:hypothetical protein
MALHPRRLALGWVMAALLLGYGALLDRLWGPITLGPVEVRAYGELDPASFDAWRARESRGREERVRTIVAGLPTASDAPKQKTMPQPEPQPQPMPTRKLLEAPGEAELPAKLAELRALQPRGVFATVTTLKLHALLGWALPLSPELGPWSLGRSLRDLGAMTVWCSRTQGGFALAWLAGAWLVWGTLGGVMHRLMALDATRGADGGLGPACDYVRRRCFDHLFALVVPLAVAGVTAAPVLLGGLLFNLPVLDVLGGLLLLPVLLGSVAILLLLALQVLGAPLFLPVIAVEGSDGYDAASRGMHYLLSRPWYAGFLALVAAALHAVGAAVVGCVLLGTLGLLRSLLPWVVRGVGQTDRFRALLPADPRDWFPLADPFTGEGLAGLAWLAAFAARVSAAAFLLLLPGFLVAQASALSTWAYLLLRKRGDGTDLAVVFAGEPAASQARETDEPSPAPVKAGESDPSEEGG